MNITVKDVPEELHSRLKQVAEESGRSVNKLIIHALGQAILPQKTSRMELVHRIRDRRKNMRENLSLEQLHNSISDGRV